MFNKSQKAEKEKKKTGRVKLSHLKCQSIFECQTLKTKKGSFKCFLELMQIYLDDCSGKNTFHGILPYVTHFFTALLRTQA